MRRLAHAAIRTASVNIPLRALTYTLAEIKDIRTGAGFTDFASVPAFGYYRLVSAAQAVILERPGELD